MAEDTSYSDLDGDDSRSKRPAFSAESLIDGWPFAEAFFSELDVATRNLTYNENRGIARLGKRLGRFIRFNRYRLAYLAEGLSDRQRLAFAALPYLLHVNERGLPGYSRSRFVVHGLSQFDFNETIRGAVSEIFQRQSLRPPPGEFRPVIRSLFVVSDIGTLAQREADLIRFYAVVDLRGMGETVRRDLALRLDDIVDWAQQMGLSIEFVLVDPAWSREGDFAGLRGEPARGFLNLERFYRVATHLVGDLPVFWCTTPGSDLERHNKTARLAERVDFDEKLAFVDLGYVDFPPVAVRRRAMLALLNHDAFTPISVVLNLVLLVHGANASSALCEHLKSRIYKGQDFDQLIDPYILLFDAACIALAHHAQWHQLSFIRRLFILKIALQALKTARSRRSFMASMARIKPFLIRWGWDQSVVDLATQIQRFDHTEMSTINLDVTRTVLGLYQEIAASSKNSPGRFDEEEVALLGRRLLAGLGRSAGRIPLHFTYLIHEYSTHGSFFILDRKTEPLRSRWAVYKNLVRREPPPGEMPIYVAGSIASILSWAAANELVTDATEIRVFSSDSLATTASVREVVNHLNPMLRNLDPLSIRGLEFGQGVRIISAALVVNFEQKRQENENVDADRRHYLAANWDVLNYGRNRDSQVQDIAVITRDSWDQVKCLRARGRDAVRIAMRHVFADRDINQAYTAPVEVFLPDGRAQRAVHGRIVQVLQSIREVVEGPVREQYHRSFAYEVGGQFQVVRRTADKIRLFNARSLRGVIRLLSPCYFEAQEVKLDVLSPTLADFRSLWERREADRELEVAVGWRNSHQGGYVLVCDSTGRMYLRNFAAGQLDALLLRVVRRIIHQIRHRVRDMRTLRRVLRVFEMRDGRGQGDESHMYEDTVRILRLLSDKRAKHPEIFLRGTLAEGRGGIAYEYAGDLYSPKDRGRRFAIELLARLIKERDKFADFNLFIEASTVQFEASEERPGGPSIVRQLRLIDVYERLLVRALRTVRGKPQKVMMSKNSFNRGDHG